MPNDFRYAFRMLMKSPGFTIVAVLTLALGIGANTAIFSVVDAVLLKPLPFRNPGEIVAVKCAISTQPGRTIPHSYPNFVDYREQSRLFASIAAWNMSGVLLRGDGEPQPLRGVAASPGLFKVLQTDPILGRAFNLEDDRADTPRVMVISYALWQRLFAADPAVIGRHINVGYDCTIIGVMPRGWKFPVEASAVDFATPLVPTIPRESTRRGANFLNVVARLNPGVSLGQAQAEFDTLASQLRQRFPDYDANMLLPLRLLHDDVVSDVRPALLVLLGAVAVVLLIACANVANLLLARAASRQREIGVRAALGASRARIVRQLLAESGMLSVVGGSLGLLLAWWSIDLLAALPAGQVPSLAKVTVNTAVCLFAFGIAVVSTFIFGLVPALQISRADLNDALQQGGRGSTGGVQSHRVRNLLVISQVALSLLLLAGAGLLIKSFWLLRNTDPGFKTERLYSMGISARKAKYPEPAQRIRFLHEVMTRFAAIPGIEAVGGADPMPFSGSTRISSFTVVGQPMPPPGNEPEAGSSDITGGFFAAMGIPLKAGRTFGEADTRESPPVAMVNETFARTHFGTANPVGEEIIVGASPNDPQPARQIVGVVADSRHDALGAPPRPEIYIPFEQSAEPRYLDVVLRSSLSSLGGINAAVRTAARELDSDIYVPQVEAMEEVLSGSLARPRFNMAVLALFAGVATTLAAIGIYGVIAYSVAQRTKEIGIRMALGAQRQAILRMILSGSMRLVGIGMFAGVVAALLASRLLSSMLYSVRPSDSATYVIVAGVLGSAALLASYLPARRAMRVDPMVALRHE